MIEIQNQFQWCHNFRHHSALFTMILFLKRSTCIYLLRGHQAILCGWQLITCLTVVALQPQSNMYSQVCLSKFYQYAFHLRALQDINFKTLNSLSLFLGWYLGSFWTNIPLLWVTTCQFMSTFWKLEMAMPIETKRCPLESQEICCKTYFALSWPLVEFHWLVPG